MYSRLRLLRESLNLTQEEFGKSLGIAKTTYNNYEKGTRDPKSDFWIAVAQKYNVSIDYLMGFSDIKNPRNIGLTNAQQELINLYNQLNNIGQKSMLAHARGLTTMEEYTVNPAALKFERKAT